MRHLPLLFVAALAASVPAAAGELDVRSSIDAVTVYPDGATVTRVVRVDLLRGDTTLIARDFPPGLDPSSLRVEGESAARVVIGAIDARLPRAEQPATSPELERRIEALRDERAAIDDQIAAETSRKNFAQRFADKAPVGLGEKGEARPLAEWRAAFTAVSEEIAAADAAIRASKVKQRDIDRELARLTAELKANPARKMEVRIDLAADADASATLRVSYSIRGARWVALYDARLDTGARERKPSLELVRRAEIVQATGEDWNDVALSVSTVRTGKGGNAPELQPMIVRYDEPRPAPLARKFDRLSPMPAPELVPQPPSLAYSPAMVAQQGNLAAAVEREAVPDTSGLQAVFRIPGRISIATNEGAKSFRIAVANPTPDLLVRAAPGLDDAAYLQASFKHAEDAPLLPGRISLYRDGIYVGRSEMAPASKEETVRLGFGADDQVKVVRATVRRSEGSSGIISSSKTDEREFKITVRNGHAVPMRVCVEDQVPVSETADVAVEMLPATTPPTEHNVRDRRGVVAWTFDAPAGEARDIKLAWRVSWPAAKAIVFEPGRL
jgi:uncharacterized protein (TIGR02231 family)